MGLEHKLCGYDPGRSLAAGMSRTKMSLCDNSSAVLSDDLLCQEVCETARL